MRDEQYFSRWQTDLDMQSKTLFNVAARNRCSFPSDSVVQYTIVANSVDTHLLYIFSQYFEHRHS